MKTFKEFEAIARVAVHFADKMDRVYVDEMLREWYELYLGMKFPEPLDFLKFHLPADEVNRDTHDFWLDEKGLMILYLQTRCI